MSGLELFQPLSASGGFAPEVPQEDPSKTVYALVKNYEDNQLTQPEQAEHSSYDKSSHDFHRARRIDLESDSIFTSTTSQQVVAAQDSCDDGSSAGPGSSSTGPTSAGSSTYATSSSSWESSRDGSSTSSMRPPNTPWACPFFVRALTLGEHFPESCHGFNRIGDVRQHINRRHRQPPHCPLCGCIFTARQTQDLREHITQRKCTRVAFELPGVTNDQWGDICARARAAPHTVNGGDIERWFQIWDVLFPGVGRPSSPFMDGSVLTMRSRAVTRRFLNSQKGSEQIYRMFPMMETEPESNPDLLQEIHGVLEDTIQSFISFIEKEEDRSNYHNRTTPP